jgi:ketosteroid isomerase-like protein
MTETATSTMQHSQELIDWLAEFYRAANAADLDTLSRMMSESDGIVVIGTDPREWWEGPDKLRSMFAIQMQEMGSLPLTVGSPVAYVEGDMGWIADRPTLTFPDASMEARLSVVVHKEDGEWKMVHGHFSLGVANEEALGQELTV